jgi:6-phosphogluconolactonase (cycloisomerase 2 family)
MKWNREREINFILAKSSKKMDRTLAENAYDILPSWRDIDNKKHYIFALVEDRYETYWVTYNVDDEKLNFINTNDSIGEPILEYSISEVSNRLFKILIKDNPAIDFCRILTELSMHDSMILYIKLTQ